MRPLINIHTHKPSEKSAGILQVINIRYPDPLPDSIPGLLFSSGIHPWDTESADIKIDLLEQRVLLPEVIALGECGLDRLRGATLEIQAELFQEQAAIAERLGKPVIIHCVMAWEELIRIRLKIKPAVAWIIHGFRGKPELAAQLIRHGFYLSFGPKLLDEGTGLDETFAVVPNDRIFFETDEGEAEIRQVYEMAASLRQISLKDLQTIIYANFKTVFGNDDLTRMAPSN